MKRGNQQYGDTLWFYNSGLRGHVNNSLKSAKVRTGDYLICSGFDTTWWEFNL